MLPTQCGGSRAAALSGNIAYTLVAQIVGDSQRSFEDGFKCFFTRNSEHLTAELKRSEIWCESVLRDALMWREPPSRQRRVALAGIHVNGSINVLAVAVDDVFTSECVVLFKRFVCPKAVGIDGQRLGGGFRGDRVLLTATTIRENEHRWPVLSVRFTPARGQPTRARLAVALAAFPSRLHVEFVDLNRSFEMDLRRVQRFLRALDAPIDRLVRNVDFDV